jgi:hypothetical protein
MSFRLSMRGNAHENADGAGGHPAPELATASNEARAATDMDANDNLNDSVEAMAGDEMHGGFGDFATFDKVESAGDVPTLEAVAPTHPRPNDVGRHANSFQPPPSVADKPGPPPYQEHSDPTGEEPNQLHPDVSSLAEDVQGNFAEIMAKFQQSMQQCYDMVVFDFAQGSHTILHQLTSTFEDERKEKGRLDVVEPDIGSAIFDFDGATGLAGVVGGGGAESSGEQKQNSIPEDVPLKKKVQRQSNTRSGLKVLGVNSIGSGPNVSSSLNGSNDKVSAVMEGPPQNSSYADENTHPHDFGAVYHQDQNEQGMDPADIFSYRR